jgi:hypothetical protein
MSPRFAFGQQVQGSRLRGHPVEVGDRKVKVFRKRLEQPVLVDGAEVNQDGSERLTRSGLAPQRLLQFVLGDQLLLDQYLAQTGLLGLAALAVRGSQGLRVRSGRICLPTPSYHQRRHI